MHGADPCGSFDRLRRSSPGRDPPCDDCIRLQDEFAPLPLNSHSRRLREKETNLLAMRTISSQRPKPNSAEKSPIPFKRFGERSPPPPGSLPEKTPTSTLPARKATTIVNKHPDAGTVHPYEIRARQVGQLIAPRVISVRQYGQRIKVS